MNLEKKPTLNKKLFDQKASGQVLAQAVRVYLGNQRKASAKTKTRSDVNKTTAKMFKQKGTGNARHGSYAAPIFVGGGVAHGPSGEQNYSRTLPKAMFRKAILGALTERAEKKSVWLLEGAADLTGKTKEVAGLEVGSGVVVVTGKQKNVTRAFRNLEGIEVVETDRVHPYHILAKRKLIITTEAVEELIKKYVN